MRSAWQRLPVRFGRGLRPVDALALLLLALTAVLALWLTPTWRVQAATAAAEADALQRHMQQARREAGSVTAERNWVEARASLPDVSQRQELLADLLALAVRHGVSVARSDLRTESDAAPGVERYRIVMPARADYAALRSFIEAALLAQPALSLDDLQLSRRSVSQADIEAQLQWSLHLRQRGAVSAAAR